MSNELLGGAWRLPQLFAS